MQDFNKANRRNLGETGVTHAAARLPGLDIEVVHRPAHEGAPEQISIHLTAAPTFEAFGRALEGANPFSFWMRGAELTWLLWREAARSFALPWAMPPSLPRPRADNRRP
jgi:hypothetical protein